MRMLVTGGRVVVVDEPCRILAFSPALPGI